MCVRSVSVCLIFRPMYGKYRRSFRNVHQIFLLNSLKTRNTNRPHQMMVPMMIGDEYDDSCGDEGNKCNYNDSHNNRTVDSQILLTNLTMIRSSLLFSQTLFSNLSEGRISFFFFF